jgi:hypothetical protein
MRVMRRSRWLARLAAMLVVGVAGLVAATSAPAQVATCAPRLGQIGYRVGSVS